MADKKPDTVTLTHPSGGFTVTVSPDRAAVLRTRGYTEASRTPAKK